jgi:hypothetical protein
MKKIEWQGWYVCMVCGYSSGKFPGYDEVKFCPICGTWGDAIVPINAESCEICYEPTITGSDGLCDKCRKEQNEQKWDNEYRKEVEEELAREAIDIGDNAKKISKDLVLLGLRIFRR